MRGMFVSVLIICLAIANPAGAQQQQGASAPPKTKMEAFTGETGVVVIKGYTEIGSVSDLGKVAVTALTLRNAQNDETRLGIQVYVHTLGPLFDKPSMSYIDLDEIDGLLKGIDYIAKADAAVTKLKSFEATYSTKGDLKITVFSSSQGARQVAVHSGYSGSAFFTKVEQLQKLRALIVSARETLDKSQ